MIRLVALVALAGGCSFDSAGLEWAPGFLGGEPDGGEPPAPSLDAAAQTIDAQEEDAGMLAVPESTFLRGCGAAHALLCRGDELPQRLLHLAEFQIDRYEVTRRDYKGCVEAGGCSEAWCEWGEEWEEPQGDRPAVCVTWLQARDFCSWAGKRLPTEAEWEKAARGVSGGFYPWGEQPEPSCVLANFDECGLELHDVGRHPDGRSPFGVDDLAGNAFEWVEDWYGHSYYATAPESDPQGPANGDEKVARGGSFAFGRAYLRTSLRSRNDPSDAFADLGFRCAR